MSAVVNQRRGERTDRIIMVILDDSNVDVLRKVMSVYFCHHVFNELYLTDTDGVCKKTSIYYLDFSARIWKVVFKILNLAGYYVVHDVNYPELWLIGTREELVDGNKYREYMYLLEKLDRASRVNNQEYNEGN